MTSCLKTSQFKKRLNLNIDKKTRSCKIDDHNIDNNYWQIINWWIGNNNPLQVLFILLLLKTYDLENKSQKLLLKEYFLFWIIIQDKS